jgi:hypothetical protein
MRLRDTPPPRRVQGRKARKAQDRASKQTETVRVSIKAMMRTVAFRQGVADAPAGRPPRFEAKRALLHGLRIQLDRGIDVPCGACGHTHTIVVVAPGAGAAASLNCVGCDRLRGSLPNAVTDFLSDLIDRFGRPSETVKVQNPEIRESK